MTAPPAPDFGAVAEVYDAVRPPDAHWREVLERLVAAADLPGGRVLDVGCGTGRLAVELAGRGVEVTGVDSSPEMLAVARRKLPSASLVEGRAEELPFADSSFDRAVFFLVVHLLDRPAAFAEARRVLAPGGRVAIVTFDRAHFGGHYLQAFFPSIRTLDEQRFPDRAALVGELADAGFERPRVVAFSQRVAADRDSVLRRVRARHISTLQLVSEAEHADGLARLERELPPTVRYENHWLLAVSAR